MSFRLPSGGLIDRDTALSFSFDGKTFKGVAGDTLASALLANGVRLYGRSFKYHRPRGLLTAGSEEPNALVELRGGARREPNTRATGVELFEGLEAQSQNRWPSLGFDLGAVNSLASPILNAGFYYKTFKWPASWWEKVYEPAIRKAAGLGRASDEADPDIYDRMHAFCDVLVIGGGPAGLIAAREAGRSGARVILADDDFAFGGRLLGERYEVGGVSGGAWAKAVEAELASLPNVRLLRRTCVFGVYDGGVHGAVERVADHLPHPASVQPRQRLWKIVARRVILASGAVERPLVFGGNDRPGVMIASAVRTYLNRFAVAAGRRAAVFTTTDDGWKTADDLIAAGVAVDLVIDARAEVVEAVQAQTRAAGVEVMLGGRVIEALGSPLHAIDILDAEGRASRRKVDLLAMSGGWNPAVGMTTHLGGKPVWSDDIHSFVPGTLPSGMTVIGAACGAFGLAQGLAQASALARDALTDLGFRPGAADLPSASDDAVTSAPLWRVEGATGKAFVDFQNDVTDKDVALAAQEGFRSVEHLKRYTTLGMATDQGKTSNVNGHALLAEATKRTISEAGTTLSRPPYLPVAIGAFAGSHTGVHFRPARQTAGHGWAERQGAVFTDAGQWKRAQWFAQGAETWQESVNREVLAVRNSVGVCDVSTLGKIDIQGPDAAVFLDRVYINSFSNLAVGRTRYGVMLREDGIVLDDGTTARVAADRYIMSTTTVNAAKVMQHLEFCRQVLWPDLKVRLASVTEQWAQYAVAGRHSRAVIQALLGPTVDLSDEAFPYMATGEFTWGRGLARLFRLSFSGELAYEIAVPAQSGERLIATLMAAGERYGITPYGTEALSVMRIEKGHAAGAELNGQTTAADLGMGRMMSAKKDFIGKIMAARPGLVAPDRMVLTGFRPVHAQSRLRSGAHLLSPGAKLTAEHGQGWLTSTAWSPTLDSWIGLGLLKGGAARHGERLRAYDPLRGGNVLVEACSPVFFDPEGGRLHGRY